MSATTKPRILEVNIARDAIEALAKVNPTRAIEELIWNSLDADATETKVMCEENPLGGIDRILVRDDGHGISHDEAERIFEKIGGSSKTAAGRTAKFLRPYHGKEGKGRYKAFALGSNVSWISRYKNENDLLTFTITADKSNLKAVAVVPPTRAPSGTATGCEVVVTNVASDAQSIGSKDALKSLLLRFAPYLLAHKNARVSYLGHRLNPQDIIDREESFEIVVPPEGDRQEVRGALQVVEWKQEAAPTLYLCDENEHVLEEASPGVRASRFNFTAYLASPLLRELNESGTLSLREMDPRFKALQKAVENALRGYFRKRLAEESSSVVTRMKQDGVYPYKDDAKTNTEVAEREVYDIVATKVHEHLPDFETAPKAARQFTYTLIKEALERNPSSLTTILTEVVKLNEQEQEDFATLITKTPLGAIIRTSKMISDRLTFINGLEQIIHDKEKKKLLLERSQLHRLLIEELWIFGEQYTLGADDVSLKTVLQAHLKFLKRDELAKNIKLSDVKELTDIPDIALFQQYNMGRQQEYEHLVIELKRPLVKVGLEEITQVKGYANAVFNNPHFDKEKTHWTFIVLSDEVAADAESEVRPSDREYGHVQRHKGFDVWVKTWSQVIQQAKVRHQFVKDKLEYAVKDNAEGIALLREKYSHILGPEVLDAGASSGTKTTASSARKKAVGANKAGKKKP